MRLRDDLREVEWQWHATRLRVRKAPVARKAAKVRWDFALIRARLWFYLIREPVTCEFTYASSATEPKSKRQCITWLKVRQRPIFWPSGRVSSTLRARQCSPTTAPSGAGSGVPFFPGVRRVSCRCTPEGPPTRREVSTRGTAVRVDTVFLLYKAS